MKKILLIGDSISAWYKKLVRVAFEGQAEVYFPAENCRFASEPRGGKTCLNACMTRADNGNVIIFGNIRQIVTKEK